MTNPSFQAEDWYDDFLAFGRATAAKVWGTTIEHEKMDSESLHMKAFSNTEESTQAYLHTCAADDETRVVHFSNPRVLEMLRRLFIYFQRFLPELRILDFIKPATLVIPIIFVRLVSRPCLPSN